MPPYGGSPEKDLDEIWRKLMVKFGHPSITPPFPTKYNHGTIRNDGNIDSV